MELISDISAASAHAITVKKRDALDLPPTMDVEVEVTLTFTSDQPGGLVRSVTPTLVVELGFEGIQASPRHKSGIAVRFPRMLRLRWDKPVDEADTLESVRALLKSAPYTRE